METPIPEQRKRNLTRRGFLAAVAGTIALPVLAACQPGQPAASRWDRTSRRFSASCSRHSGSDWTR